MAKKKSKKSKKEKKEIIQTHKTHKGLVSVIFGFLLVLGIILYVKILSVDQIAEANYKVLSLGLLFSLNLIMIILTVIFIVFYIEFKDEILEK
mgnify:CR=1 FL=1